MKYPFRACTAQLTAALILFGGAGVPVHAADSAVALEIDTVTLTADELAALDYTVPVYVRITENTGFNVAEFGVAADERCTCTSEILWLDYDDGFAITNENLTWRTMAAADVWADTGTILRLDVTLPPDAQPGDTYEIAYVPEENRTHIWQNLFTGTNYLADGTFRYTDGCIRIIEEDQQEPKQFTFGRDNWHSLNSFTSFGAEGYALTDAHYAALMEGLSNKEKERIDTLLQEKWHGSCYGMAATAVLAFHDILNPADWQMGAETLYDISNPPNSRTRSLIHYYYALQKTDAVQQAIADAVYVSTEEEKLRRLLACLADDSPTLLTYLDYNWGGHAVVAYDVTYAAYHFEGKSYNGKILIYDNNFDTLTDSCCLYFNTQDWSWCIPGYQLSSCNGSYLGIITDDTDVINYHGCLDGTTEITADEYISILSAAPSAVELAIKQVENGALQTSPDAAIKAYSAAIGNAGSHEISYALPDADCGYEVTPAQPTALSLTMDYAESLLSVSADCAAQASFDPSGMISLSGSPADYCMKLVTNTPHGSWYRFMVEGSGAQTAVLQYTPAGCVLTADDLTAVSVAVHGNDTDALLGFSADYDSVLLYEVDAETLAAAADTDGDGSYETCIASSDAICMGDTTLDGICSAVDVIALNRALLGASLNTAQAHNADADGDGVPTAMDALRIWKQILGME